MSLRRKMANAMEKCRDKMKFDYPVEIVYPKDTAFDAPTGTFIRIVIDGLCQYNLAIKQLRQISVSKEEAIHPSLVWPMLQ